MRCVVSERYHWYFFKIGNKWENTRLQSLDPRKTLEQAMPFKSVLGTIVYPACEIISPGIIQHIGGNRFSLGEPSGEKTTRAETLSKILVESPIGVKFAPSKLVELNHW